MYLTLKKCCVSSDQWVRFYFVYRLNFFTRVNILDYTTHVCDRLMHYQSELKQHHRREFVFYTLFVDRRIVHFFKDLKIGDIPAVSCRKYNTQLDDK
jgi:hypothetical protein